MRYLWMVAFLVGCQGPSAPAEEPVEAVAPLAVAPKSQLVHVEDVSEVCMANDQFMGGEQRAVELDGRTYHVCCPLCQERLERDAALRVAVDPVSGREVDKARAVIGKMPDDSLVYFESLENLRKHP